MFQGTHHILVTQTLLPFFKVFLLTLAAISHYVGFKSPNPPPSKEQVVYKGQLFERVVRLLALASRMSTILTLICECVVLLSLYYPTTYSNHILAGICSHPSPTLSVNMSTSSPSFLLGISIMLSSAALRVWCFNALGKLFTFEVTIKPEHRLVTAGPYSYVRHPSYTGCVFMLIGAAITCFASGSFVNECHIMATPSRWPIRLWLVIAVFATVSLFRRGKVEDEGLRKVFGETWDRYSRAVPHRFLPYLF